MNNQTDEIVTTEGVVPDDGLHHAMCEDCYPFSKPKPDYAYAWCGKWISTHLLDGTGDPWTVPPNACGDCIRLTKCARCGVDGGE